MSSRREALVLTLCALLMVALGGATFVSNWVVSCDFTADDLPADRVTMQEYEVYAAIINRGAASALRTIFPHLFVVIFPETYSLSELDLDSPGYVSIIPPPSGGSQPGEIRLPSLRHILSVQLDCAPEEIARLERLSLLHYPLKPNFVFCRVPYEIARSGGKYPTGEQLVQAYGGLTCFSRVAFSYPMTRATVCVGSAPSGPAAVVQLERRGSSWVVINEYNISSGTLMDPPPASP